MFAERKGKKKKEESGDAAGSDMRMASVMKNSEDGGFLCAVNEVICLVMRKVADPLPPRLSLPPPQQMMHNSFFVL